VALGPGAGGLTITGSLAGGANSQHPGDAAAAAWAELGGPIAQLHAGIRDLEKLIHDKETSYAGVHGLLGEELASLSSDLDSLEKQLGALVSWRMGFLIGIIQF
jgi:hypothetical protein